MARAGSKLGRHPTQSGEKDGKGKQDLDSLRTASASKAGKKMTRRQQQPRAKLGRETSLRDKAAAAAKREIMKGDKLGRRAAAAAKSEIRKGDKLERQGGSGSQKRNHEGRQVWETRRQRQPRAKS